MMAKGTLTFRAEVRGPQFARFAPFEIQTAEAGVEKVVVACPDETPVELSVAFSSVPSVESACILGREIARKVLDRIACKYCLSIQEPAAPSAAFQVTEGAEV